MEEHKLCPFCGQSPKLYEMYSMRFLVCRNPDCPMVATKVYLTVVQWNTRPCEQEITEMLTGAIEGWRRVDAEKTAELEAIEHAVAQVYGHFSKGRVTKCNTDPQQVIAVIEDVMNEDIGTSEELGYDWCGVPVKYHSFGD